MVRSARSLIAATTLLAFGPQEVHAAVGDRLASADAPPQPVQRPPPAPPKLSPSAPNPVEPASVQPLSARIDAASAAWQRGDYPEARELLMPIVTAPQPSQSRPMVEVALRYLADSILLDQTLDADLRRRLARTYIERQFNEDPDWVPPPGLHGDAFYELAARIRSERESAQAANCAAERMACQADLREVRADKSTLERKHHTLATNYAKQLVVIEEKVARNRAVALVPLGIGHFYNGRYDLGATFLATEAVVGAVGLGLMLNRIYTLKCRRTDGFAPRSLRCDPPDHVSDAEVKARRQAEQAFGLMLIGTALLDVLFAQLTFESYATVGRRTIERDALDQQGNSATPSRGKKPAQSSAPRPAARAPTPTATFDARPALSPTFAGLQVRMSF